MEDLLILATIATIGSLCLLAIIILLVLLVLRRNKTEDIESGPNTPSKSFTKKESLVVMSDQSYYCMIGSSDTFTSSSETETETETEAETSDNDTSNSSEEDIEVRTKTDKTTTCPSESFKKTEEEDLNCSMMTENRMMASAPSCISITSLNISQLFKEDPKQSGLEEDKREYVYETVDIKTKDSNISFINIENSSEAEIFMQNEKFLMSPQARRDLEIIEKKILVNSKQNSFKPFKALGLFNRFSYFYCLGLDLSQY